MVNQYFPWRYHIVSALRSGQLPLWNPYNFAGYPIHADPQSGAWYMPLWLFALFGNYTAHANAVEVFLHIWLAGLGMYLLVNYLYKNHWVALLMGVAYIGCGVIVGNGQHFTFIISACWLPYILLYFVKAVTTKTYKNALVLAVFLWLLFTGGYPAFFIILTYILGIATVFYYVGILRRKESIKQLLLTQLTTAFAMLLLCLPSLISFALYANDTTRSEGITLAKALMAPFRKGDVESFFNPMLAAIKITDYSSDVSMVNGYFGLVPLVAFAFAIGYFKQIKKQEVFIMITAVICLLAAFGDTFFIPVREWLFHLPGLNLFRVPAIFRMFTIIGFMLCGAWALAYAQSDQPKIVVRYVAFGKVVVAIAVVCFNAFQAYELAGAFKSTGFWVEYPSLAQAAITGGAVQLLTLGFIWFYWKNVKALLIITLLNTVVCTQLNIQTTMVSKHPPAAVDAFLADKEHTLGFDNTHAMGDGNFKAPLPLSTNLSIFYRQPTFDGYSPFVPKRYGDFEDTDTIKQYYDKPFAYADNAILQFESANPINTIAFNVKADTATMLVIQQHMVKYWTITLNGNDATPQLIKRDIPTIITLPAGTTAVRCEYRPPYILAGLIISLLCFVGVLGMVLYNRRQFDHIGNITNA